MYAADDGHADTVKALLEKGADVAARDRFGDTALALAQRRKRDKVVLLLQKAANNPR